jgi:hypothetical protein
MKAASKASGRVLDMLTKGLAFGEARKIDNAPGAFMAVHVDHIDDTPLGPVFSVAHYYEQCGDLVADPDVTFLRGADGQWYPLSFQDSFGYRRYVEIGPDGEVAIDRARQLDLAQFVNMWMRNIKEQQGL